MVESLLKQSKYDSCAQQKLALPRLPFVSEDDSHEYHSGRSIALKFSIENVGTVEPIHWADLPWLCITRAIGKAGIRDWNRSDKEQTTYLKPNDKESIQLTLQIHPSQRSTTAR